MRMVIVTTCRSTIVSEYVIAGRCFHLQKIAMEHETTWFSSLRCGAAWNSMHASTSVRSCRSRSDLAFAKRPLGFHTSFRSPTSSHGAMHVHRSICARFARCLARPIPRFCSSWMWPRVVFASRLLPSIPFERRQNSLSIGTRSSN